MEKEDLIKIFKELDIPTNEGIQNDTDTNKYPRIVFWEFLWVPIGASGEKYNTKVTYQVSFYSKKPRDEKLLKLKEKLNEKGINPIIEHEFAEKKRDIHSYFAIEVLENV